MNTKDQFRLKSMAISDALKDIRKRKGLTQGELANLAGVELTQISRIERGVSEPKLETIKNLAIALNCSTDELILEDIKAQPNYINRAVEKISKLTPLRQFVILDMINSYIRGHEVEEPPFDLREEIQQESWEHSFYVDQLLSDHEIVEELDKEIHNERQGLKV
ncbi:helix-turn-helix domain-containing protein [Agarivorans sp. MS3-6]